MKHGFLVLCLCVGISMNCLAEIPEENKNAFKPAFALPTAFYSSDSEGFNAQKTGGAFYPYYEHGNHFAGLQVNKTRYSHDSWKQNGMQYRLVARDISPRTGMGYNLDVGLDRQGGKQLLIADSSWGKRWSDSTATELFISRDWVETRISLDKGVSHTFAGGSIEQKIMERLSIIGVAGEQYFSDGNLRTHGRARLIYDLIPDYGITLQFRGRTYYSSDDDVNGDYFNPRHYKEGMVAFGVRKRIDGWVLNATAGLGRQYIDSDPSTVTKLFEAGVTSPIDGKLFMRAHAGYNQSSGVNGPDYTYRYAQCDLVFPF